MGARQIRFQVAATGYVHLFSSMQVAVAKMVQGHGRLNETFEKISSRATGLRPKLLPHFVGLEKLTLVEVLNALQIARIVRLSLARHQQDSLVLGPTPRPKPDKALGEWA